MSLPINKLCLLRFPSVPYRALPRQLISVACGDEGRVSRYVGDLLQLEASTIGSSVPSVVSHRTPKRMLLSELLVPTMVENSIVSPALSIRSSFRLEFSRVPLDVTVHYYDAVCPEFVSAQIK